MKGLKKIPRSRAKTAYGLVSDVIRAIKEEPKRVDMNVLSMTKSPDNGGPACGTVGCFAGWVSLLHGRMPRRIRENWATYTIGHGYGPEEVHAHELLGACDYTNPEGSVYTEGYVFSSHGIDLHGEEGSPRYARSVIARIRRFQKRNARVLRAKKLEAGR